MDVLTVATFSPVASVSFVLGLVSLTLASCSQPASPHEGRPDLTNRYLFQANKNISIAVPNEVFATSHLPKPAGQLIDTLNAVIDYRYCRASSSSVKEDPNTVFIHYKSYVFGLIDHYLSKAEPNYYSKYRVVDTFTGLKRLRIAENVFLTADRQDQSFILAREIEPGKHDLMIECQQFSRSAPEQPCDMFIQFPNGVVAQTTFSRAMLPEWAVIETSVRKFSDLINISAGASK